jgi:hypothetical protein
MRRTRERVEPEIPRLKKPVSINSLVIFGMAYFVTIMPGSFHFLRTRGSTNPVRLAMNRGNATAVNFLFIISAAFCF